MLPLFDEAEAPPSPAVSRIAVAGPEYTAFWSAFHLGAGDHDIPAIVGTDAVARYTRDGFRIGRLFRPLACMRETR